MAGPFHALPILLNLCAAIDQLYIEQVGPFGQMVTAEARATWLQSGNKLKTSDVDQYIRLLAKEMDDPLQRSDFVAQARKVVGVR